MISYQEFLLQANDYYLENMKHLRYGQAMMNFLSQVHPNLERCVPMDVDPYQFDDVNQMNTFFAFIENHWDEAQTNPNFAPQRVNMVEAFWTNN